MRISVLPAAIPRLISIFVFKFILSPLVFPFHHFPISPRCDKRLAPSTSPHETSSFESLSSFGRLEELKKKDN
jgi:hypothetical protein